MKLRTTLFALGLAAVLGGIVGCGSGGDAAKDAGTTPAADKGATPKKFSKKDMKITLIAKSSTNPVFLSARTGAEDAAKELSKSTGVNITIDWQTPPTEDGKVQADKIAEAVNGGSDAIIISCSDNKVNGAINDAVAKGVPVMTFDSDAPDTKRFAFYGADDADAGKQTMDELATQLGGKGTIAILAGNQNAPNLQKRVKGVMDEAPKYPGIKVLGTFYHVETPQDAAAEVIKDMKANPDIKGWAMIGGWPLFTKALLDDSSLANVKIVAVDALPAELIYVDKGMAPVLLAQPTYKWGQVAVQSVVDRVINGKDVPVITKMDLVKVSKENLGDWARQLKAWGFPFDKTEEKYLTLDMKK